MSNNTTSKNPQSGKTPMESRITHNDALNWGRSKITISGIFFSTHFLFIITFYNYKKDTFDKRRKLIHPKQK